MDESDKNTPSRSLFFLDKNPDGLPFADILWNKRVEGEYQDKLPSFLKPARSPVYLLILLAAAMFVIGFIGSMKAIAAVGAGMLLTLAVNYWRVWKQSGDWVVESVRYTEAVTEGGEADLRFVIRSRSGAPLSELEASLQFSGSQQPIYRQRFLASSASQQLVHFVLKCDRGMGDFSAKPIYLSFRDPMGLFALSLEVEMEVRVEARPNIIPLQHFPQPDSGISLNSGSLKSKRSGESVSFLGIREWRTGDGIRKIDWKRSLQGRQLMVKVFESDISTDVTLIMDTSSRAHSEFAGLSSIETMRDSAVSLSEHFLSRQQRVQLFAGDVNVPFGGGAQHCDFLIEQISDLKVEFMRDFADYLKQIPGALPNGSMVCLMLGTSSCTLEDLLEFLLALEIKRVELFLILFDSERFAHAVTQEAKVEKASLATLQTFYKTVLGNQKGSLHRLVSHLPERTLVIGPGDTLAQVVEEAL